MLAPRSLRSWLAGLIVLAPAGAIRADGPAAPAQPAAPAAEEPGVSLLDAARAGSVGVSAEGTGDGQDRPQGHQQDQP